jgi:UDP-galactopyranose mutase
LDAFYGHRLGRLGYRTVTFERHEAVGDYQGNAVINYPEADVPFTRIHEHKHFAPWEQHENTVYFKEYSKETEPSDIPYYPKRLEADKKLLKAYRELAEQETNLSFLGRLATYRYMDMGPVIAEALGFAQDFLASRLNRTRAPVFPNSEE